MLDWFTQRGTLLIAVLWGFSTWGLGYLVQAYKDAPVLSYRLSPAIDDAYQVLTVTIENLSSRVAHRDVTFTLSDRGNDAAEFSLPQIRIEPPYAEDGATATVSESGREARFYLTVLHPGATAEFQARTLEGITPKLRILTVNKPGLAQSKEVITPVILIEDKSLAFLLRNQLSILLVLVSISIVLIAVLVWASARSEASSLSRQRRWKRPSDASAG